MNSIKATSVLLFLLIFSKNVLLDPNPVPPSTAAFNWFVGHEPTNIKLFQTNNASLNLILTDAPVIRIVSTQAKRQLFRAVQILDLTNLSRQAHNLKRSISLLESGQISLEYAYKASDFGATEFLLTPKTTFFQCENLCQRHEGQMFGDLEELHDFLQTFIRMETSQIGSFWVQTTQQESLSGLYSATYNLTIMEGNQTLQILPQNEVNNFTETVCQSFYDKVWTSTKCKDLGTHSTYFRQQGDEYIYYSNQMFRLHTKLVLDHTFDLLFNNNLTETTRTQHQLDRLSFIAQVPTPRSIKPTTNQFSSCVGRRPKFQNANKKAIGHANIQDLDLLSQQLVLGIERERVKNFGNADISSVDMLSRHDPMNRYTKPVQKYLEPEDIFRLSVNSNHSLQIFDNKYGAETALSSLLKELGNNHHMQQSDQIRLDQVRSEQIRADHIRSDRSHPKALALGPVLTALKVVAIGLPFLLEESRPLLQNLGNDFKHTLSKPRLLEANKLSSKNFASYLEDSFPQEVQISVQNDRINMALLDKKQPQFHPHEEISPALLAGLKSSVNQYLYFQENLLEKIPNLIFERNWPEVKARIVPETQIHYAINLGKSFLKLEYIWQEFLSDSQVTQFRFLSLPTTVSKDGFQYFEIQNLTLGLSSQQNTQFRTDRDYLCQARLLTDTAATIRDVCPEKTKVVQPLFTPSLFWENSRVYSVTGPSNIHYQCGQDMTRIMQLKQTINVLLVGSHCAVHVVFPILGSHVLQSSYARHSKINVFLILQYTPLEASDKTLTTTIWRISVTVIITLFITVSIGVVLLIYRFKQTLGIRLLSTLYPPNDLPVDSNFSNSQQIRVDFLPDRSSSRSRSPAESQNSSHPRHAQVHSHRPKQEGYAARSQKNSNILPMVQTFSECIQSSNLGQQANLTNLQNLGNTSPGDSGINLGDLNTYRSLDAVNAELNHAMSDYCRSKERPTNHFSYQSGGIPNYHSPIYDQQPPRFKPANH